MTLALSLVWGGDGLVAGRSLRYALLTFSLEDTAFGWSIIFNLVKLLPSFQGLGLVLV